MYSVVSFIIVIGILVFVHELGHFLFCKLLDVGVEKFSLGFGPKLAGFRRGETEYLLSALPLGGYVKMFGETGVDDSIPEEQRHRTFMGKSPVKRILIVAAGPLFNILFAWLILIVIHLLGVPAVTTKIGDVIAGKPAARAGIQKGDEVTAINGEAVSRWDDLSKAIIATNGKPVLLQVKRGGERLTFTLRAEMSPKKNIFGESVATPVVGIVAAGAVVTERFGPVDALLKGTVHTFTLLDMTVVSLVKMVERVVPIDSIGGPIMIAKMAGEQATAGGVNFLAFMALVSINLGILNLLPVPVLDGGHLLFYTVEMIFRRPVSMKVREVAQQIGLLLLISLMVLAFYNDIIRYFLKLD